MSQDTAQNLCSNRSTHQVFTRLYIPRVTFLILPNLSSLTRSKTRTRRIYRSRPIQFQFLFSYQITDTLKKKTTTDTGSTLPSPSFPSPDPSVQPIIFNNLFPTLLSSFAGATATGGVRGRGGPSAERFVLALDDDLPLPARELVGSDSGRGTSGWLKARRRCRARSRYWGFDSEGSVGVSERLAFAAWALVRAIVRRLVSLKFFYSLWSS